MDKIHSNVLMQIKLNQKRMKVKVVLMEKYELDKRKLLGRGTFGKVYRGRNLETNQKVAIKILSKDKVAKEGLVDQTKREIKNMRMLKHPNIVELYDAFEGKEHIYLIMEYAKGSELLHRIAEGKLEEEEARNYFQQLITTVDFCHKKDVYHRDLNPENLLLDGNGVLKVSGFGLSALAESKKADGLLHTICGSRAYVAPEVLRWKAYDGAKADKWSYGVILFVLLAGQLPFHDKNEILMCTKICEAEYKGPEWFTDEVQSLLSRILNTNPDERILISEIMENCWYREGSKSITNIPVVEDPGLLGADADSDDRDNNKNQELSRPTSLNDFDLIYSSGLDLSGLLKFSLLRLVSVCSSRCPATLS